MKKLSIVALIAFLAVPFAFAEDNELRVEIADPTAEASLLDTVPVAEESLENIDLQAFVKMAIHELEPAVPASTGAPSEAGVGGNCTLCTTHQDCSGPCGGFGACVRDFGHLCDVDWFTKVCACG